jgi:outer membrane protein
VRIKLGSTLGMLLLSASSAAAQQIPQQLTLQEAQRIAGLFNPAYRRMQNDVQVAEANVRQSYGRFMPNLNTNLNFGGSNSSTVTATDDFGQPITGTRRIETESSSASQGASMGMTLFDGGASFRNLSASKAQAQATESRVAQNANQLRAQVAREYFNAMRAEQRIKLEETLLASRKDALARTEKLLTVASTKYVDVLSARVDVATAEQAVEDARGLADKARLQLKQIMGVEGPATFTLATEPPAIFDPATVKVDALVQTATVSAPAVLIADAGLRSADKQASAARATRWPSLTGSLSYGRSTQARGYGALGELNPPNRSFGFGLGVSLPVFSRFTTSAQIANADASEIDARETLREAKLQVESEVRAAHIDLTSAYRTVQMAQRRAELSRERLLAAEEEYRLGAAVTFLALQQYADQSAQAERQVLDALFQFATALIALEERIAKPLER